MFQFEPIVQEGNEAYVHHVILFACYHNLTDDVPDNGHICYYENMPLDSCISVVLAWAVGGDVSLIIACTLTYYINYCKCSLKSLRYFLSFQPFYFPQGIGYPVGKYEGVTMFKMEMHYDNPGHHAGTCITPD